MENANLFLSGAGFFVTIFGAVWSLAWWLSGQFTITRNIIFAQVEKLQTSFNEKLSDHEREDNRRFIATINELNELKVKYAAIRTLYLNGDGSGKQQKLLKEQL